MHVIVARKASRGSDVTVRSQGRRDAYVRPQRLAIPFSEFPRYPVRTGCRWHASDLAYTVYVRVGVAVAGVVVLVVVYVVVVPFRRRVCFNPRG